MQIFMSPALLEGPWSFNVYIFSCAVVYFSDTLPSQFNVTPKDGKIRHYYSILVSIL